MAAVTAVQRRHHHLWLLPVRLLSRECRSTTPCCRDYRPLYPSVTQQQQHECVRCGHIEQGSVWLKLAAYSAINAMT